MGTFQDPELVKWVQKQEKLLKKDPKKLTTEEKKIVKTLEDSKVKGLGSGLPASKAVQGKTKGGMSPIEKMYYKDVFEPKQKLMIQNAVASNPNLKLKEIKDKKGNTVRYDITNTAIKPPNNKYPIKTPSAGVSKDGAQRARVPGTYETLRQVVKNEPFNIKKVDKIRKDTVKPDHGGNGFFSGLSNTFKGLTSSIPGFKEIEKLSKPLVSNLGKITSSAVSTAGQIGGAVGNIANTAVQATGSAGSQIISGAKQGAGNLIREGIVGTGNVVSETGRGTGVGALEKAGKDINRETRENADPLISAGLDIAANVATTGVYGGVKTGLSSAEQGGIGGLVSSEGLKNLATSAVASQTGIDPSLVQAGLAASKGDLKGATLAGLGSYAGLSPDQLKMTQTGLSAITGDKQGIVSGLASQFGVDENISQVAGSLAGGKNLTSSLASGYSDELGIDNNIATALGGDMDFKKIIAQQLGSLGGIDPKVIQDVASGKVDPMKIAQAAGIDPSKIAGNVASQFGAGGTASNMIGQFAAGRGAGNIVSDQANAYIQDESNQLLDARAGMNLDEVRAIQDMQRKADSAYKIAKGDTFDKIAAKMGLTREQLKAANPQIKDINKIAAGAKLNIPSVTKVTEAASGARQNITDKYLKDASGKTILGPNNAPIRNPNYNEAAADELTRQRQGATGETIPMPEEEPGMWDRFKTGVSSAFGGATDFVTDNKGIIGTGAQAVAAGLGYKAQQDALKEQQDLFKSQLKQEQAMGSELMGQKFDPNRYAQEQKFLTDRIKGQGRTAITRQMEQESIQKTARTAAAGRLAGLEQQARLGGAALGTAGLAASLSGAQSGQNVMAEDMRARDVQAQQDLERAIVRTGALSTQRVQEEADLARRKYDVESGRATAAGATRSQLGQIEQNRADALAKLYTTGADVVKEGLSGMKTPEEQAQEQRQQHMEAESKRLDLEKKRREVYGATPQQTPPPPATQPPPPAKVDGARRVSQGTVNQQPKPAPAPTARDQFNYNNIPGAGEGYGVLAPAVQQGQQAVQRVQSGVQAAQQKVQQGQQTVQKVQGTVDEAKKKAEQLKNDPLGAFGIKL